ncbi:MAG: hypothetical protein JWN45_1112, partial [Acidobacteriaceae bacterium]|nr:hypothetical protein [Acidobacteriaceae bacterium]
MRCIRFPLEAQSSQTRPICEGEAK